MVSFRKSKMHQIWHSDGKSTVQGDAWVNNQVFENSKWRTAAILNLKSYYNSFVDYDIGMKFCRPL